MQDRIPVNPGRVLITPENDSPAYYATMIRADNPTQEGTPLNKASLLKDTTAALFGLGADALPDDALATIKTLIDAERAHADTKAQIAVGKYTGTGKFGSSNKNTLAFDFAPKVVIIVKQGAEPNSTVVFIQGATGAMPSKSSAGDSSVCWLTWSGNSVTWYATAGAEAQFNDSIVHNYVVIG